MTKTTEVLEEPDVCSSVDLESSSESKAEGAGRSAADAEEPSPPAVGPSCSPQKPSEVRGLARSAPPADVPVERTAQHLPISRKGLSLKVFELLPEELILWLGVILPLFVLAVGYLAYFSEFGINPIPTVWHALVVGIVPVANLLVWKQMRNKSLSAPKWLVHLNGMAIGVSLIYTLQYGWLLPVGILLTFFLIGLMVLCPVLALLCSLACRGYLCTANAQSGKHRLPGVSVGIALSLVLLGLPFVASLMSECGLHLAGSNSRQQRQQGLDWLRQWGDRRYLLRSCYQQPDATIEWLGSVITDAFPIGTSRARKVYYQVTGDPFQSVELKEGRFARWWQTRPDFDEDQGGTVVGRPAEDLSLQTSRMEVFIDPEVSLANIEWTLVMKNHSWRNQEARIQIALPPGGVVSRVTLWVNGKERDAVVA